MRVGTRGDGGDSGHIPSSTYGSSASWVHAPLDATARSYLFAGERAHRTAAGGGGLRSPTAPDGAVRLRECASQSPLQRSSTVQLRTRAQTLSTTSAPQLWTRTLVPTEIVAGAAVETQGRGSQAWPHTVLLRLTCLMTVVLSCLNLVSAGRLELPPQKGPDPKSGASATRLDFCRPTGPDPFRVAGVIDGWETQIHPAVESQPVAALQRVDPDHGEAVALVLLGPSPGPDSSGRYRTRG
jgi:hypothetical protein